MINLLTVPNFGKLEEPSIFYFGPNGAEVS